MEIARQIKKLRSEQGLSQEALAEKVYVSRQTISNWENEKNYPDIHSLIMLSELFDVSLDELIKGDVEVMKEEINKEEIKKFTSISNVFAVLMIAVVVTPIPLTRFLGFVGAVIYAVILGVTIYVSFKVEKIKKSNNIQTYKEITAFLNGKRLDEISAYREEGKRVYQKIFAAVFSAAIAFIVCTVMAFLLK